MSDPILSLRDVWVEYGDKIVLEKVSLDIAPGSFVSIVGPSGAGKSTFLRLIIGQEAPTRGHILLDGAPLAPEPGPERGVVFQRYSVFPHLTAIDNVAFGLDCAGSMFLGRLYGRRRKAALEEAGHMLEKVGLAHSRDVYPAQLSGGMQQRLAIAQALVRKPRILLLDEPFGALDRKLREAMQAELRELTRRLGITAIFVTHDQEEALLLSDRIAVMNAGRIEQLGTPAEIYEAPATRFVASFMGADNILECDLRGGAAAIGGVLHAVAGATGDGAAAIGLRPERIGLEPPGNGIAARVVAAVYLGAFSSYRCRLEGCGTDLVVRAPNPQGAVTGPRFVAGEAVALTIAPGGLRALRA
jgi:NitT/TauT family transport system ATP-binding protein